MIELKVLGLGDNVVDKYYNNRRMYAGGNAVNFAVYSKMLGFESAYLGVLARDIEGELVTNSLKNRNIDISKCIFKEGETGRCVAKLTSGDRTIIDENDAGLVKKEPLQITNKLLDYIKGFDIISTNCNSYIDDQLFKIKSLERLIVYDFSDKWDISVFEKICPNINIAFFSGKDLENNELKKYLKIPIEYGCELSITTNGDKGSIVFDGQNYYFQEPYNKEGEILDTLGAGDAFISAFVTTYCTEKLKFDKIQKINSELNFIKKSDIENHYRYLIDYCMSLGNLLARKICMIDGAFDDNLKF